MYAEVMIPLALPKNYTWAVPESMRKQVMPGVRVEVVLGKNKKYAGVIKKLIDRHPGYETKDILNVLDAEPILFPAQMELWEWIAGYYMCSEGEVMAAALPAHFKLTSETVIVWNEEAGEVSGDLDDEEFLLAEALALKKQLTMSEAQEVLQEHNAYPVVKRLIDRKICFVWESLKETYRPKKETYIQLHADYSQEHQLEELLNGWTRAPKQMELLLAFLHLQRAEGNVTRAGLLKKSGASDAQLKGLVEKGILLLEHKRKDRISYGDPEIRIDFTLSPAQEQALAYIREGLVDHDVCLLHGVTSSGKTQVYIRLIEEQLKKEGQVLYLLPEIALTSQIIRRLEKHFGGYIGIYHSKFSQNERIEIWNRIRTGKLRVVLGARSALFLPFHDLRLIIVDEEHDASYKQQDPAPRYQARDTAIYYATALKAKVVLGSATPSVESYFNARSGKYALVEINERFGGIDLPEITLIPNRKITREETGQSIITDSLTEMMKESLQQKKQVILFQNRRGYTPYQICQVCGWLPRCKDCDVTLTFHKRTQKLHCHYCGRQYAPLHTCQACGSDRLEQKNFGTEKIEELVEEILPDAQVARMDIDTVRGKHAHDQLIQQFESGKIDILIGTQMVVKGLDFERVQLVGILDADSLLSFSDYRVNERAFQLIEQVSGRAGRKDIRGKVAMQIINTSHPLIPVMVAHDYKSFFETEIEGRRRFFYPPYSRLILLTFRHRDKVTVDRAAAWLTQRAAEKYDPYRVGPAEPVVGRIRNQYLMELLFKLPKKGNLVSECKKDLMSWISELHQQKGLRAVVVTPDVDR